MWGMLAIGLIYSSVEQYTPIKATAQTTNNNTGGLAASPKQAISSGLLNSTGASNSSGAIKGPGTQAAQNMSTGATAANMTRTTNSTG